MSQDAPGKVEPKNLKDDFGEERVVACYPCQPADNGCKEHPERIPEHVDNYYEDFMSAMYERRGWTSEGVPKPETLERLGLDDPEVMALCEANQNL